MTMTRACGIALLFLSTSLVAAEAGGPAEPPPELGSGPPSARGGPPSSPAATEPGAAQAERQVLSPVLELRQALDRAGQGEDGPARPLAIPSSPAAVPEIPAPTGESPATVAPRDPPNPLPRHAMPRGPPGAEPPPLPEPKVGLAKTSLEIIARTEAEWDELWTRLDEALKAQGKTFDLLREAETVDALREYAKVMRKTSREMLDGYVALGRANDRLVDALQKAPAYLREAAKLYEEYHRETETKEVAESYLVLRDFWLARAAMVERRGADIRDYYDPAMVRFLRDWDTFLERMVSMLENYYPLAGNDAEYRRFDGQLKAYLKELERMKEALRRLRSSAFEQAEDAKVRGALMRERAESARQGQVAEAVSGARARYASLRAVHEDRLARRRDMAERLRPHAACLWPDFTKADPPAEVAQVFADREALGRYVPGQELTYYRESDLFDGVVRPAGTATVTSVDRARGRILIRSQSGPFGLVRRRSFGVALLSEEGLRLARRGSHRPRPGRMAPRATVPVMAQAGS